MKKNFFSLLAIAALASCTKTEATYEPASDEIKLAPVTSLATKANVTAAIDGTAYPTAENFDVYAYWANEPAGSVFTTEATDYLSATTSGVEFVNKGQFWGGATTYYWPKNGSLRFAAYSPADLDMTHVLSADTYTLNQIAYPTNTSDTYEILVAPTSESYTAQTATEKVSVVFEHALSWLTFKVKSTEAAKEVFTVKNVVVNDVKYNGSLVADMLADTKTWTLTDDVNDINVYYSNTQVVGTDAVVVENVKNGVLVIPQATTEATIVFDQKGVNGTPDLSDMTVTIPLILDAELPWEPGKHYTYTVIFDLDEILINPSVEDWVEVNVPVVEAGAIEVNNEAELISAVAAGKSVRLINDIEVSEPVVVNGGDVLVELNGYDITAAAFAEAGSTELTESYGFWVKGGELTINGPGSVTTTACTYSMAVWANGGKVTINGGEYYNAGHGSDLIYVSGTGSEVVINGGYFKACESDGSEEGTSEKYSAINLKGNGANGEKATVYGGTFYGFNPADNKSENPAVSFVADGYNVVEEGDCYTVYASENANIVLDEATTIFGTVAVTNGTLDGAGYTLTAAAEATDNGLVRPAGDVLIKNITIAGAEANQTTTDGKTLRAVYINAAGNYVLDNVTTSNVGYALNISTTEDVTLKVTNSNLNGWVSYGSSTTADFTNVKFAEGQYNVYRPYGTTVLTNCDFTGMEIDLGSLAEGETIVFESCTFDGKELTTDNLTGYEGKESYVTVR